MFNKLKTMIKSYQNKDKILITIHGFGVNRKHQMDEFVEYASGDLMEVVTFDMFDIHDENDCDFKKWISKAEIHIQKALNDKKKVYLLGFSMGGVIASHLASKYKIEKLILISPAFIHLNLEYYTSIAIQTGKKLLSNVEDDTKPKLPNSFYNGFLNCVKEHKNDIGRVTCPVLIIQGDEDEVIPTRSSEWAYNKIEHDQKKCIFLHKGKHRILVDENVKDIAFTLIHDYLEDKILPIENSR